MPRRWNVLRTKALFGGAAVVATLAFAAPAAVAATHQNGKIVHPCPGRITGAPHGPAV